MVSQSKNKNLAFEENLDDFDRHLACRKCIRGNARLLFQLQETTDHQNNITHTASLSVMGSVDTPRPDARAISHPESMYIPN